MKSIMYIFLFINLLPACSANIAYMSKPYALPHWRQKMALEGIEGAPAKFNMGWKDGCETGAATSATHLQRLFYGFKINEEFIEDDQYYNGWNKAFRYCHRYLYQYHRKSFSN